MMDNRLAKYVLLYAGVIALSTLVYAHFADEKLADKAIGIFGTISLSGITGILGYLTAKNDATKDDIERYNELLEDYERLRKELNVGE
jgi:hypothetical protein